MEADLALLDLKDRALLPLDSAARQMVVSETGCAARTALVYGRVAVRGGRITTVDEAAFRDELAEVMRAADADTAALAARQEQAIPPLLQASARLARKPLQHGRHIGRPEG